MWNHEMRQWHGFTSTFHMTSNKYLAEDWYLFQ
jgi:hypothetical protein